MVRCRKKITYGFFDNPLGRIVVGKSEKDLVCWVGFMVEVSDGAYKGDGFVRMKEFFSGAEFIEDPAIVEPLYHQVMQYWQEGREKEFPLDLVGTDFQCAVWRALFDIKKGKVLSGQDIVDFKINTMIKFLEEKRPTKTNFNLAKLLLNGSEPTDVVAGLLQMAYENDFDPNSYKQISTVNSSESKEIKVKILKGKSDNFNGKTMIQFIEKKSGLRGKEINNLKLLNRHSFFTVPQSKVKGMLKKMNNRRVLVELAK